MSEEQSRTGEDGQVVNCPRCGGQGTVMVWGAPTNCPRCKGSGLLAVRIGADTAEATPVRMVDEFSDHPGSEEQ